jgi:hypothetical protein
MVTEDTMKERANAYLCPSPHTHVSDEGVPGGKERTLGHPADGGSGHQQHGLSGLDIDKEGRG